MIKAVTFDLDGVFFVNAHNNIVLTLSKEYRLKEDFIKEVLFEKASKDGGYDEMKKGLIKPEIYWNWLFNVLGIDSLNKEKYIKHLLSGYKINQKAVNLIGELHKQNIKTAICSNNYKDNIEALNKKFNIRKYFDVMVFSYEVKVMKPDKKIYLELIKRLDCKPNEVVIIDDKKDFVNSANNLGIQAFFYEGFGKFIEKLKELGVKISQ